MNKKKDTLHINTLNLPRVSVDQPVIWQLGLETIVDTLQVYNFNKRKNGG